MEPPPPPWSFGNAPTQSITEVLHNPNGPSLQLPDLSSFDLSSNTPALPPRPPPANINHFEPYLRIYAPLHAKLQQQRSCHLPDTPSSPTSVPDIYYSANFSPANNPHLAHLQPLSGPSFTAKDVQSLKRDLGAQRTALETQLRTCLIEHQTSIDSALERSTAVREELLSVASQLRSTRERAAELVPLVTDGLRLTKAVLQARDNVKKLRAALGLVHYAMNAPTDVKELIQTGEYEGAIGVLDGAKKALARNELKGVKIMRGVGAKVFDSGKIIETALVEEFNEGMRLNSAENLQWVVGMVEKVGGLKRLTVTCLRNVKEEVAGDLEAVRSLAAGCGKVRDGAKRLRSIMIVLDGKDNQGEETGKATEDWRQMQGDLEDLLVNVVDRFLGSFECLNGGKTGTTHAGFVTITEPSMLTEQSCFDELKGGIRFAEELRQLENTAEELDEIFGAKKKTGTLKAKISERRIAFMTEFHKAHVGILTKTLRGDKWQETPIPQGAIRLLTAVLHDADSTGKENGNLNTKSVVANAGGALSINGVVYKTVASGVRYIRSVCAYALLAEKSPRLAPELARRGTELSRIFNSLVGRAILGAQALQWSGLRSITARHLSLASRSIAMGAALAGHVNNFLAGALSGGQVEVILPIIEQSEKDLKDHHQQLLAKILAIMMDRLEARETILKSLPWAKAMEMQRFEIPSAYVTALVKETTVLHRILWAILPSDEVCSIFHRVCAAYGSHLTEAYSSLDGSKEWIRLRVAEDVSYLHERLHILDVFKENPTGIKPITKLYVRFAKEYNDEKSMKQEKTLFPGRTFVRKDTSKPANGQMPTNTEKTTLAVAENGASKAENTSAHAKPKEVTTSHDAPQSINKPDSSIPSGQGTSKTVTPTSVVATEPLLGAPIDVVKRDVANASEGSKGDGDEEGGQQNGENQNKLIQAGTQEAAHNVDERDLETTSSKTTNQSLPIADTT